MKMVGHQTPGHWIFKKKMLYSLFSFPVKTYIYNLSGCLVGLDVIAAGVIGGGSLSGGEGSVPGMLIGALIMTVIRSGCSQMGLPNWVQEIITGSILVIAVSLDRLRRRKYNF